jgi:hypothetical protein
MRVRQGHSGWNSASGPEQLIPHEFLETSWGINKLARREDHCALIIGLRDQLGADIGDR